MHNSRLIISVGVVMTVTLAGLAGGEWLQRMVFPQVDGWSSHFITMVESTIVAVFVCYVVLHKSHNARQKKSEEELRESEKRYRELTELLPQPVFEMGFDGTFTFANQCAFELFGYREEDLRKGLTAFDLVVAGDRKLLRENMRRHLAGDRPCWTEYTAVAKDGRTFPVMVRAAAILRDGQPVGLRGVLIDVSERKRSEETQRRANEYLENILEHSPDAIAIVDRRGKFTRANKMCAALFGYSLEEVQAEEKSAFEFYASREELDSMLAILRREGSVKKHPMRMKRRDHSVFPAEVSVSLLLDGTGRTIGSVGVVRDVSKTQQTLSALQASNEQLRMEIAERQKMEEALRKSEDTYRTIFEHTGTAMVIIEEDSTVCLTNSECQQLLGYPREEMEGRRKWADFIDADDVGRIEEFRRLRMIADPAAPSKYEFRLKHRNGETKHILGTFCVIPGTRRIVASLIDLTEQKKLETDFLRVQKMESLGVLAGGIAHDFNNILAAIIGYTELAMICRKDADRLKNYLDQILRASLRVKDLVKQILDFSRRGENEHVPVQVASIVREALKLLRASLPATIEIRQDIRSPEGLVYADPSQIHQVLMNLCTNAAHAMQERGGILEVNLAEVQLEAELEPGVESLEPGAYLRLSVTDTGIGMSREVLGRIFEPYFTTKQKGVGTGLGLAVVHGIVKSHHGAIRVHSEEGKGSAFHIFLPTFNTGESRKRQVSPGVCMGKERILLVDDEELLADALKQGLEHLSYKVEVKTSSTEALEAFRSAPDTFDLVITDMTMPGMTGKTLAREMMAIRPDLPVILCTGFSMMINEEEAKALGIKELVFKPLVIRDFANIVRKVLDERTRSQSR